MSEQPLDAETEAEAAADEAEDAALESGMEAMRSEGRETGTESAEASALIEEEFRDHINRLQLRHFGFREFLFLGGSHHSPGSRCFGMNLLPPKPLWGNLDKTALVLDELRQRLGAPIRLHSIYRNERYNSCLSGTAAESQHKEMRAVDFSAADGKNPGYWRSVLLTMRDTEAFFKGGIGVYNTFVHVDTRGHRADWDKRT